MKRVILCLCWLGPVLVHHPLITRHPALERFHYSQIHMGVQVRLVVYATDREAAARACRAAFQRIEELDAVFSDWRRHSELMHLCAHAGGSPMPVSRDLFRVLRHAQDLAARTGGAFDVTVGPFVRLWRRAQAAGALPAPGALAEAREQVGWNKLRLHREARAVELLAPGMQLDLGGIAKGYALDEALKVLNRHGITRALLQAGGDMVAGEAPPRRAGWRIRVVHADPPHRFVELANAALSTSGDSAQYVEIDGVRYSHIVDPRTGLALTTRRLVTVVAADGITADSLATAIGVLSEEERQVLLRQTPGARAYVRRVDDEQSLSRERSGQDR